MNIHPLKNVNKIIIDKRGCLKSQTFKSFRPKGEIYSTEY